MECQSRDIVFPLKGFNYEAQLVAIGGLLYRQEQAEEELSDRIKEADEVARRSEGRANDYAVDVYVELAQMSCYQDMAHSMAAVSMIAPLIESVFRVAFRSIGKDLPRKDIAKGIVKGVGEIGMMEYLPTNLEPTLSALFAYRNKMFHGGFEWSAEKLNGFERRLEKGHWPSKWFDKATSDDKPWMFYMTPAFVDHCFAMAKGIVEGIEQFGSERNSTD